MGGSEAAAGGVVLVVVALVALFGLATFAFWVWSLVDAAKRPDGQWEAANQSKILWLVVIIVVGFIGSVLYAVIARPALKRIQAAAGATFDPTAFGVPHGGLTYTHDGFGPPASS